MTKPTTTAVLVATRPGSIKEWFRIYLPMPVVLERSKLMAAMRVPYVGKKKYPFTAGHAAARYCAGIPKLMPNGIMVRVVAAWLKRSTDVKNRPMINVIGYALTIALKDPMITASLPLIKVSPNQASPKMPITAVKPAWAVLVLGIASIAGLVSHNMMAESASMTIWMVMVIDNGSILPLLPGNCGRRPGKKPETTIKATPARNIRALNRALGGSGADVAA